MPRLPRPVRLRLRRPLMLGAIAVTILALASGASAFNFTTIDVPGAMTTAILDINARGDIVGYFRDGTGSHGFIGSRN